MGKCSLQLFGSIFFLKAGICTNGIAGCVTHLYVPAFMRQSSQAVVAHRKIVFNKVINDEVSDTTEV